MAEVTHYVKMDNASRTTTATSAAEETNYTISWSNLTTAGFAASDSVIVIVGVKLNNNTANTNYARFQVGFGTSYAGRVDAADSYMSIEACNTGLAQKDSYLWFDQRTLVTNENIYFSTWGDAGTSAYDEFFCLIIKLGTGGLTSTNYGYAEADHSGTAPDLWSDGATFNTPASGDWLLFGLSRWLINSTTADFGMMFQVATVGSISETWSEGEDNENEVCLGDLAYRASVGSSVACMVQYRASASHECDLTKIFGIRLNAFEDHWGAHTSNTITHTVLDTFQEFAGNGSYSKTSTGNILAIALPIHNYGENTKAPYGRIQLNNASWNTHTARNSV